MEALSRNYLVTENTSNKKSISTFGDKFFALCCCFLILFRSLNYFIGIFFKRGFGIALPISPVFYGLGAIIGVLSYVFVFLKCKIWPIILFFFFSIGTAIFCFLNPNDISLIFTEFFDFAYSPAQILFLYCLPTLNYLFLVKDYKYLLNKLYIPSFIIILLAALGYFAFAAGRGNGENYMSISYNVLPCACICGFYTCKNKFIFILSKIMVAVSFVIIFIGGARGAAVCSVVFFLSLIFYKKVNYKLIVAIILITIIGLVLLYTGALRKFLLYLENKMDDSSRTISRILEGSFFKSGGRDEIYSALWKGTLASPILGHGLWGERVLIDGFSHNFFLEALCSFGFILGLIIILFIVLSIAFFLFKGKQMEKPVFILFLCALPYGFISLFFSGSCLNNEWFFFILGLILIRFEGNRKNESDTNL